MWFAQPASRFPDDEIIRISCASTRLPTGLHYFRYSLWSEETLPNPDLEAVENRPWLWSRPYTFIELQHLTAPHATIHKTPLSQAGFDGFTYGQPETEPTLVSITDLHTLT